MAKRSTVIAAFVVGVPALLGALASYKALDGPMPASTNQVEEVEQYGRGTRELVLLDKLVSRKFSLAKYEKELEKDPDALALQELVVSLKRQVASLESELKALDAKNP